MECFAQINWIYTFVKFSFTAIHAIALFMSADQLNLNMLSFFFTLPPQYIFKNIFIMDTSKGAVVAEWF